MGARGPAGAPTTQLGTGPDSGLRITTSSSQERSRAQQQQAQQQQQGPFGWSVNGVRHFFSEYCFSKPERVELTQRPAPHRQDPVSRFESDSTSALEGRSEEDGFSPPSAAPRSTNLSNASLNSSNKSTKAAPARALPQPVVQKTAISSSSATSDWNSLSEPGSAEFSIVRPAHETAFGRQGMHERLSTAESISEREHSSDRTLPNGNRKVSAVRRN